jgi:hypothetical protein
MGFISLQEVLDSIVISAKEKLKDIAGRIEKIDCQDDEFGDWCCQFWNKELPLLLEECRFSEAAREFNQARLQSKKDFPELWEYSEKDLCHVKNSSVNEEGTELLRYAIHMAEKRLKERLLHIAYCMEDGKNPVKDGYEPSYKTMWPPLKNFFKREKDMLIAEGKGRSLLQQRGPVALISRRPKEVATRLISIGFDRDELVKFLDKNRIKHDLPNLDRQESKEKNNGNEQFKPKQPLREAVEFILKELDSNSLLAINTNELLKRLKQRIDSGNNRNFSEYLSERIENVNLENSSRAITVRYQIINKKKVEITKIYKKGEVSKKITNYRKEVKKNQQLLEIDIP